MTPTSNPKKRYTGPIHSESRCAKYSFTVTTWTPSPVSAFKYAGSVAINVLPSPVRISEILPAFNARPPISCTSKWRIPNLRFDASRVSAKASGINSSSGVPAVKRALSSRVFSGNCSSFKALTLASKPLTAATVRLISLMRR